VLKLKLIKGLVTLAAMALSMSSHSAETVARDKYVFASVSFVAPDSGRDARAGEGAGLGLSLPVGELWNLDLRVDRSTVGVSGESAKFRLDAYAIDMRHQFSTYKAFRHYWVAGLGLQKTNITKLSGSSILYNVGLGTQYLLHNDMQLRLDLRYRRDEFSQWRDEAGFGDIVVSLSLDIPLGMN